MNDRAVQDFVIRALADASFRRSSEWIDLQLADASAVERFSRFLARHFYYERLVHFFKYSRALAHMTKISPVSVLKTAAFNALIPSIVLGGRESAAQVADLARSYLRQGDVAAFPYQEDLLSYQREMMVLEAGPRVEGNETGSKGDPLVPGDYITLDFEFDIPAVLPRVLRSPEDIPDALRVPTRVIMSRSPRGRVTVLRATPLVEKLLSKLDGSLDLTEVAKQLDLPETEVGDLVAGLVEAGAARFGRGS